MAAVSDGFLKHSLSPEYIKKPLCPGRIAVLHPKEYRPLIQGEF
jgi:hypothetical protein